MTAHQARKTAALLLTAALSVALLAGCGAKRMDAAIEEPVVPAATEQTTEEAIAIATTAPDTASTETATPDATDAAAPEEPQVIAESSNTVSDKEKQQILDDLSGELGKAIDSLNGLDEPDESDMSADSIE